MRHGKLLQEFLSAESKSQQDLATIRLAARASDKTSELKAVRQFNCAVMLNLQALGQHADRCDLVSGQPLYHQHCLVLMRLDSRSSRGVFAEVQEAADSVAELSKRRVIDAALSPGCLPHDTHIISCYDTIVLRDFEEVSESGATK
jgi:hypothetical protein